MNIYYQGNPGSYMHSASLAIQPYLSQKPIEIIWKTVFKDVWEQIALGNIWVLAIENSYMGSIHPNLYGFLKYDCKIIGEYYGAIDHCLCSREDHKSKIKTVYSQSPALEQCYKYIHEFNMESRECSDTALSAKIVAQSDEPWVAGICSELAAELYWLNILERKIQDQKNNTTRFALICNNNLDFQYTIASNKISLIFEAKNIPSSLYECLWCFANNDINLSKIESLPSYSESFSYHFWIDFSGNLAEKKVQNALSALKNLTTSLRIVWEY
jgi:prephenate dehydratase